MSDQSPSRPALPEDIPVGQPRPSVPGFSLPTVRPDDPVRRPIPRREPVEIPAGEPDAVAAALSSATVPTDQAVATKLEHIERSIAEAVEFARIHPTDMRQDLVSVVKNLGMLYSQRLELKTKIGKQADVGPVEFDTHTTIRSVARFGDGEGLRAQFALRLRALRADVARTDQLAQDALEFPAYHHHQLTQESQLKQRLADLLKLKGQLHARLANLDPGGDAARALTIGEAIQAAGGEGKLADRLGPLLPETAELGRVAALNERCARAGEGITTLDPQSAKAAQCRQDLADAEGELKSVRIHSLKLRRETAAALLASAATGDLEQLGKLAPYAAQLSPEFGTAVNLARGSERDLIAVCGEIVAEDQQKRAREAERSAAWARSQQS